MSPQCLSPCFGSVWLTIREQMRFKGFQDGSFQDGHLRGHFRYLNITMLAILNLYVVPMHPIVWAQSALRFWRRYHLKNFKMASVAAILDVGMERISMSPQCLPPSFSLIRLPVRAQMSFQDFQAGHHSNHLGNWNATHI